MREIRYEGMVYLCTFDLGCVEVGRFLMYFLCIFDAFFMRGIILYTNIPFKERDAFLKFAQCVKCRSMRILIKFT